VILLKNANATLPLKATSGAASAAARGQGVLKKLLVVGPLANDTVSCYERWEQHHYRDIADIIVMTLTAYFARVFEQLWLCCVIVLTHCIVPLFSLVLQGSLTGEENYVGTPPFVVTHLQGITERAKRSGVTVEYRAGAPIRGTGADLPAVAERDAVRQTPFFYAPFWYEKDQFTETGLGQT
jgi:hypothetical protein